MSATVFWNLAAAVGAALVGGGIWAQWGAPWACIFWGAVLLGLATIRGYLASRVVT